MPNPYLPNWEYIPDGEPRVFGDRVYIYGSHDRAGSQEFCDYVLKCWSAPVSDRPEDPFRLIAPYQYTISDEICCNGWFIDPGVLVDYPGGNNHGSIANIGGQWYIFIIG